MKSKKDANILGIDYGTKNIGLSFSQGYLAEPLKTIKTSVPAVILLEIKKIIKRKKIQKIIIGLPEGSIEEKVKEFSQMLKNISKVPVILWDETLSSFEAKKKMSQLGKHWRKRKQKEHEVAACLILQEYLDCLTDNC